MQRFALLLCILCPVYGSFIIVKDSFHSLIGFSDAFNGIMNSIKTINLHDIKHKEKILFTDSELILQNVKIVNITIGNLSYRVLHYETNGNIGTIKNTNRSLYMSAWLEFDWKYVLHGITVFWGTYKSKLQNESFSLEFKFYNDSDKSIENITFSLKAISPSIKGFGTFNYIITTISNLVRNKVLILANEEFNTYNKLIIYSMIHGGLYKDMAVNKSSSIDFLMMNKFDKYLLVRDNNMAFFFLSYLFDKKERNKLSLPNNTLPRFLTYTGISLYIGAKDFMLLLLKPLSNYTRAPYEIGEELQKTLFGYELTVNSLVEFYPQLAERYNLNDKLTLTCLLNPELTTEELFFTCNFTLANTITNPILSISKLLLGRSLTGRISNAKGIRVFFYKEIFTTIETESKEITKFNAKKLTFFMQPIASFFCDQAEYRLEILRESNNWRFVRSGFYKDGLIIGYYTRKW